MVQIGESAIERDIPDRFCRVDQLDAAFFQAFIQDQVLETHAGGFSDHMAEIGSIVSKVNCSITQRTGLVIRFNES